MELLKVSSKSNPSMVAGALAGVIRSSGCAELQGRETRLPATMPSKHSVLSVKNFRSLLNV